MNPSEIKEIIRSIEKEMLPVIVLGLASEEDGIHGYQVMKELKKHYNGTSLGPSSVYPMLNELEKNGYMSSRWEMGNNGKPVKIHEATAKAKDLIRTYLDVVQMNNRALKNIIPDGITMGVIPLETVSARKAISSPRDAWIKRWKN